MNKLINWWRALPTWAKYCFVIPLLLVGFRLLLKRPSSVNKGLGGFIGAHLDEQAKDIAISREEASASLKEKAQTATDQAVSKSREARSRVREAPHSVSARRWRK